MPSPEMLLAALGRHLRTRLAAQNGVCALFDGEREAAIIEMPGTGDAVIVHCKLPQLGHLPHETLLRLNFDQADMHGFWLAHDEQGDVRLCGAMPTELLNETGFVHWVMGFISQVKLIPTLPGARRPARNEPIVPTGRGTGRLGRLRTQDR